MLYLIRDYSGGVLNKVENPAVVFDSTSGTLHKIGEFSVMREYQKSAYLTYSEAGFQEMAEDMTLMELPKDQEVIDKVFNNTGYLKILYEQAMKAKADNA